MKKPFIMLCIDASTSHFGFAMYYSGTLKSVWGLDVEGVYDLKKLEEIHERFEAILVEQNPDHVVLEKPVPMQFSQSVVQINQIVGMILGASLASTATVDWVHNRTAKKLAGVTAKGKDGKKQAIELMKAKYPEFADRIINDHIADAIIVGEAYKQICKK